jgi:hypothetical protein
MKPNLPSYDPHRRRRNGWWLGCLLALTFSPTPVHASIFKGEVLDKVADVMTWVVLVVAPIVVIAVFLVIHILPEKIAEKKHHPQTKAIQCLCLLSLFFGGLLWPLAWLWAYTKPVLHTLAYGTETAPHGPGEAPTPEVTNEEEELKRLHQRVAELEARQARKSTDGGKA